MCAYYTVVSIVAAVLLVDFLSDAVKKRVTKRRKAGL